MKADPRSKISKGNRRYRPSAKPPLRRFSPYRYEFSLLYPASNECGMLVASAVCETRPTYHAQLLHRSTNVKPSLHTMTIFQRPRISFPTRHPKITSRVASNSDSESRI
jgi:hypothetical protein